MSDPIYIVGIDLGTTNSVVAYSDANVEKGMKNDIHILEIPQLVGAGVVEERQTLPSFLFVPGGHDVADASMALPWDEKSRTAVGEFARERGAEIPHRLISSAKSWLCNTMVDRNKPILPWEGGEEIPKMSPVEASAAVLGHIRDVWNHKMAEGDAAKKIENQEIYLTVPASFDAVARELTVKAAREAGLDRITLLEEPLAAFYAWIENSEDAWRDAVSVGDLILICDVGGGTSDFSLIRVLEEEGDLKLERIAVGDHLLVGGDNMDLALAYTISAKLAAKKTKLDAWQMRGLGQSCRKAKEELLSGDGGQSYPLTVLGRGSSLIGGTIKTKLELDELSKIVLDGFFPRCEKDAKPMVPQRAGLKEMGLSYEADPAVTRHLANFISRQSGSGEEFEAPTAVFFNGGVLKAKALRERVLEVVSSWTGGEGPPVREIEAVDFDLSVGRGAAYYGLARKGDGIRIRGGLGQSYYIGLAAAMPAIPGMPLPMKALCVAPFGMEEGTSETLEDQEFVLVVGEPVKFDLLGSSVRHEDSVGTVVEEWEGEIGEVTTIETLLEGDVGSYIPVSIEIDVTEVGTLEFWCVAREDGRKWKLEFNVREKEAADLG